MSDRPTKKLTTPSGKEVELKTYLTARERNEIKNIFYSNLTIGTEDGKPEVKQISGQVMALAEEKLLQIAVVGFDGGAENVYQRILDGTPEDYDYIADEAGKISGGNFQTAK